VALSRLFHSATFRLALTYAGFFALAVAVLFAVIYWAMAEFENEQIRKSIQAESNALIAETTMKGGNTIQAEISIRTRVQEHSYFRYAMKSPDGAVIGNLPILPGALGWGTLEEPETETPIEKPFDHARYYIFATALADGNRLYVAQDSEAVDELRNTITRTFEWGSGIFIGLVLIGGLGTSWRFLRRIEGINTAAQHIIDGALNERVPLRGNNDEFDRLSSRLNQMLDRIESLVGNLKRVSSDVAHDLRTPLTHLRQGLEQARSKAQSVPEFQAVVDRSIDETDGILRTFGALLRIAEVESGQQRASFADVDLSALMNRMVDTYAPVAEDEGYALTGAIRPGLHIRGDQALLTQMIANLCENALRHAPKGTHIQLGLTAGKDGLTCSVADDGAGVPAPERNRVFRPFYRLDQSRSTPGSGLGLAMVKAICELHGGTISLLDAGPGALFEIRLPAQPAPRAAQLAQPAPAVFRKPLTDHK